MTPHTKLPDIVERLHSLRKYVSHLYVAAAMEEAAAEITRLRVTLKLAEDEIERQQGRPS